MTIQQKDVKPTAEANVMKLEAKFKETWGKLSATDITLYSSNREQFLGKLKEQYSLSKEDAEKKIKSLEEQAAKAA